MSHLKETNHQRSNLYQLVNKLAYLKRTSNHGKILKNQKLKLMKTLLIKKLKIEMKLEKKEIISWQIL